MTDSKFANVIHWSSVKCRRVTRSVLAAELFAVMLGFDSSAVIKSTMELLRERTERGSHGINYINATNSGDGFETPLRVPRETGNNQRKNV